MVDKKSLLLLYTLVESKEMWCQETWPTLSVGWIRPVPRPACGPPVFRRPEICPPCSLGCGPVALLSVACIVDTPSCLRASAHVIYCLSLGCSFPFHLCVNSTPLHISAGTSVPQVKPSLTDWPSLSLPVRMPCAFINTSLSFYLGII